MPTDGHLLRNAQTAARESTADIVTPCPPAGRTGRTTAASHKRSNRTYHVHHRKQKENDMRNNSVRINPTKGDLVRQAIAVAAALATMALVAASASAKTTTLHYFSKSVSVKFTDAAGDPVNPSASNPPAAGDVFDAIDRDYLGNHKHHAKHWTATDHLRCVFENANSATCDAEIAVGGSMLLANGIHPDLGSNPATYALNAGTGVFYGARGTLTAAAIAKTNNNDFTIKIHS